MEFNLVPVTGSAAEKIAEWRYEPPYDFYNLDADPEDYAAFMDPSNWETKFAVEDGDGTLVGFFDLTPRNQFVEVGLGMHPDLTGQGLGRTFVEAGLRHARDDLEADVFELAVATFNDRAISVYEDIGFEYVETYSQRTNGGEYEFLRMRRE
ncbi:GNAT family N-acetyltransferase [Natronosalvus rutilus]|uniref:GNAT family N-acetyltransferase n=1 Tax=Natronosalvus rutilus TaxID=2953753 RepID=A0A9E7NC24_9EURY|nr:GNAT family N-acetyltransferase [Natronosalvus rutilus]UTF53932.1 GNAT family N-acetyltransferase [Natronosalvus rutilus]